MSPAELLQQLEALKTALNSAWDIADKLPAQAGQDGDPLALKTVIRASFRNSLACVNEWQELCRNSPNKD